MAFCFLNGRKYDIHKKIIVDYISSFGNRFTEEQIDKIANEVIYRMEALDINITLCQEYNFVEEEYTDACLSYLDAHDDNIDSLINETDDLMIWEYLGGIWKTMSSSDQK